MTQVRNACITLNNWTDSEYEALDTYKTRYTVIGKEVGEQGTPHLQIYMEFNKATRLTTLKKLFPRIHVEERIGTAKDASNYCKKGEQTKDEWHKLKENGPNWGLNARYTEHGELSNQGKRTDINRAVEMIVARQPMRHVAETYPREYVKYHRGFHSLNHILMDHRKQRPDVYWYWGNTGTGKTWRAKQLGDAYYLKVSNHKWWDGYTQQPVVILDDFRMRDGGIAFEELLRWLDENEVMVEVKGSSLPLNSPIIAITCDVPPHHLWRGNDLDQILRRINHGVWHCVSKTQTNPTELFL